MSKKALFIITTYISLVFITSCKTNAQSNTITVNEFEKGVLKKNIQLLDVRTAGEYQSGHLTNALQADWNNDKQFAERTKALDKTKPIYVYCLSGGRSSAAMEWLSKNGFVAVYNMKGGINAWKQANKPVQGAVAAKQITLQEYISSLPKDKTVLVDIGAEWCPPCKKMKPITDSLENQNYTVIKIDGGTQTTLCKELNADAFPLFIVYKNGQETNRKQGLVTLEELKQLMK
ncbi:MAG: rhodanese-like domain-containing protein [Ferruginibacter sp.]|nr:thioredoxin [Ferruginibacter sp.]